MLSDTQQTQHPCSHHFSWRNRISHWVWSWLAQTGCPESSCLQLPSPGLHEDSAAPVFLYAPGIQTEDLKLVRPALFSLILSSDGFLFLEILNLALLRGINKKGQKGVSLSGLLAYRYCSKDRHSGLCTKAMTHLSSEHEMTRKGMNAVQHAELSNKTENCCFSAIYI